MSNKYHTKLLYLHYSTQFLYLCTKTSTTSIKFVPKKQFVVQRFIIIYMQYVTIIYSDYHYAILVKSKQTNGQMNIYITYFYTFWFPFRKFVGLRYIQSLALYTLIANVQIYHGKILHKIKQVQLNMILTCYIVIHDLKDWALE